MNNYIKNKINNIITQLTVYDCEKDYSIIIRDIDRIILNRKRTYEMIKNDSKKQKESLDTIQKELDMLAKTKELIGKINNRFEDPATILTESIDLLKNII